MPKGNYSFQQGVVLNSNQPIIILKCVRCGKDFNVTGIDKGSVNCPYCDALNNFGKEPQVQKKKNR
jgi:transposase-like protein